MAKLCKWAVIVCLFRFLFAMTVTSSEKPCPSIKHSDLTEELKHLNMTDRKIHTLVQKPRNSNLVKCNLETFMKELESKCKNISHNLKNHPCIQVPCELNEQKLYCFIYKRLLCLESNCPMLKDSTCNTTVNHGKKKDFKIQLDKFLSTLNRHDCKKT